MKRTAFGLTIVLALLFSAVALTQMVRFTKANPWPPGYFPPPSPYVIIHSPQEREYYNTEPILLNFTFKANLELNPSASLFYLLDGKSYRLESIKVEDVKHFVLNEDDFHAGYEGHVLFSNLSDGPHTLIVFAGYADSDGVINGTIGDSAKVNFTIVPEPFPTTLVVAASGFSVAAIAGAGSLVYFKKRKH
jgi:hypothetical protein